MKRTDDEFRALAEKRHTRDVGQVDVYAEVRAERERAHRKHGDSSMESWPPCSRERLSILMEEVGEVAKALNEQTSGASEADTRRQLREELVQVAAMAVAWADACRGDR